MKRMDNQNIYPKIKPTPSRLLLAFVLVHAKPILWSPEWTSILNLVSCKAHGIFIVSTDGRIWRTLGTCFVLSQENCSFRARKCDPIFTRVAFFKDGLKLWSRLNLSPEFHHLLCVEDFSYSDLFHLQTLQSFNF